MDKLCDLLDIRPGVTALIGGGGKTTLMYHLARELRERGTVAVTTTTKIWPPTGIAMAQDPDTAREILAREGLVCLGVPSTQGKLVSPGFEGWDALADYTLVEADGSAGKPFKGHEKHEPVLPPPAQHHHSGAGSRRLRPSHQRGGPSSGPVCPAGRCAGKSARDPGHRGPGGRPGGIS